MPSIDGLISMDYQDVLIARAKEAFGVTKDICEAGYILPNGELLDFSGKRYGMTERQRNQDHRDIIRIMEEKKGITRDEAAEFFEKKAIRMGVAPKYEGFCVELNVYQNPTEEQWSTIRRIVNFVSKVRSGYFSYDIYKGGKAVKFEYIENGRVTHVEQFKRDFQRVKDGEFDDVQEFNVLTFGRGF